MVKSRTLTDQDAALKKGKVEAIGYLVWWTVVGDLLRVDVDAAASRANLRVPKKQKRSDFTAAINEIQRERPDIVTKKVQDDFDIVTYVLAEVKRANLKHLEIGDQSWVAYSKRADEVHWKEKDPRTKVFQEILEKHRSIYTAADIRGVVEKAVNDAEAVSLRGTGGIYLVAPGALPAIQNLEKFLEEISPRCAISTILVPKFDEKTLSSLRGEFERKAESSFDSILDKIDSGIKLTYSEAKKEINVLIALERDCRSVEAILDFQADEIRKRSAFVKKEIQKAIGK